MLVNRSSVASVVDLEGPVMFLKRTQSRLFFGGHPQRLFIGWAWLAVWVYLASAADGPISQQRYTFREPHMGTEFTLVLYTDNPGLATRASRLAFDRIHAIDVALTDYDPTSELMRLVDQAGQPPVAVSADLFDVMTQAKELYERSAGAFDPSIAPVGRLWRRARRERKMPDRELLRKALNLVGGDAIRLDPQHRTVELTRAGMKLDLGGIAKGYASGEAIAVLREAGINSALVAGSGDIVVAGPPPGQPGWRIGIAPLAAEPQSDGTLGRTILLKNAAISTSGDAEQFVEMDGKRYSHVIDPATGLGLTDRRSVTVIAPSGLLADGLDTTACVLGVENGLKLVDSYPGVAALFIQITPQGPVVTKSTSWDEIVGKRLSPGP